MNVDTPNVVLQDAAGTEHRADTEGRQVRRPRWGSLLAWAVLFLLLVVLALGLFRAQDRKSVV